MTNWMYDACGEFFIYRSYVIIKQDHPKLTKYAIYKENSELSLIFKDTASTITLAKQVINELIEKDD